MPRNLNDLGKTFDRLPAKIKTAANQAAVSISTVVVNDLTVATPVDTTEALSNWIVTLGSPSSSVIGPHAPGFRGITKKASAARTNSLAVAILANKKPGQIVYITNNVDYIGLLNNGSSSQAPAGFVQRAVLLGRLLARGFKLNL